jgi:hypothetical protein
MAHRMAVGAATAVVALVGLSWALAVVAHPAPPMEKAAIPNEAAPSREKLHAPSPFLTPIPSIHTFPVRKNGVRNLL